MPFEFAAAARVVFGEGAVREVAPAAAAMGRRALVVTGASRHGAAALVAALEAALAKADAATALASGPGESFPGQLSGDSSGSANPGTF